jgi:DNA-binding phage protein
MIDAMQPPMTQTIAAKFAILKPLLDERARRLWAAVEARALGRRGLSQVAEATGLSRATVRAGLQELALPATATAPQTPPERLRRPGGGRKPLGTRDPPLLQALETLGDPVTRGDPMSLLRWTCKSAAKLAAALQAHGHAVSERTVNRLLHDLGYSLQSNRKTLEGCHHPDRDAQFQYLNRRAKVFQKQGQPVVSVDTKKKELVGQYRNDGQEWHLQGQPAEVNVYDFPDKMLGKIIPYGVYDEATNTGGGSVGVDHDTAAFAVETVRRWWRHMGSKVYPKAKRILITADGGGSNGSRCRLWKVELQRFADESGLCISVCHFPPGTSKWNKSEHRMFCHITENWRGRPLVSREVVVNLIGHTTTKTGLTIRSELDENSYPTGREVPEQQMESLAIKRDKFHGEWHYTIRPKT